MNMNFHFLFTGFKLRTISICLVSFFLIGNMIGQKLTKFPVEPDTLNNYKFEMNDGSTVIGKILEVTDTTFLVSGNTVKNLAVAKNTISSISKIRLTGSSSGSIWEENFHDTRYLFGPSARMLKKGTGYYQNTYLFLNSLNYGITDYLTLGIGTEIISLFQKQVPTLVFTPKVGFEVANNFNLGGGVFFILSPKNNLELGSGLGIAYGVGTYGKSDHNITFGSGFTFGGDVPNTPIFTFSGMTRVGRRLSLVTENWLIANSGEPVFIGSYAVRIFGGNLAVDLGFINNKELSSILFLGVPWIDLVIKF